MTMTAQGQSTRRSDGKAVNVVVPVGQTWNYGDAVYADGYVGIAQTSGVAGDVVALEIEAGAVHELTVPGTIATNKGDLVYITLDGTNVLSSSATNNRLFGRVWRARDSNNVAWIRLAAQ